MSVGLYNTKKFCSSGYYINCGFFVVNRGLKCAIFSPKTQHFDILWHILIPNPFQIDYSDCAPQNTSLGTQTMTQ